MLEEKLSRKEAALQSFEQEIETLNKQLSVFSHDNGKKHLSSSNLSTNVHSVPSKEITKLEELLTQLEQENNKTLNNLQEKILELDVTKEKLAVAEASNRNGDNDHVEAIMGEIQMIWRELGIPSTDREVNRMKIDTCLEDTCTRMLDDAKKMKQNTLKDIDALLKSLKTMYLAQGQEEKMESIEVNVDHPNQSYYSKMQLLQAEEKRVTQSFNFAVKHVGKISKESKSIISALELPVSQVGKNLSRIIDIDHHKILATRRASTFTVGPVESSKDERAKKFKKVEEMMKALESDNDVGGSKNLEPLKSPLQDDVMIETEFEPDSLSDKNIDNYEKDLKKLKALKSEVMVANQQRRDAAKTLTNEMNLNGKELLSLCIHSIKKRSKAFPKWWDRHLAEEVCRSIVSRDCVIGIAVSYTKHLNIITDSLQSISLGRSALSNCLKTIIEDAHNTLLKTVEEDADVNEAYSSFDKALSRLPKLSKEHICACIDEMNTLVVAVDGMCQSEIEALTVVWESLNVTNSEKGQFWSNVKDSTKALQSFKSANFEEVKKACAEDIEEWVISAIKESMKINRSLGASLLKLSEIHTEVEKLRSKSDAKSKILSLDSELRIQSLKLAEFEEKAGNKHRLVTKKLNSSSLLQEERFRKQMQNNFSSKLHKLVDLLKEWQVLEGKNFDEKMLSEDVNAFLRDPDHCGDYIEQRTAFMHLKTVKQKIRRRAVLTGKSLNNLDTSKDPTSSVQTQSEHRIKRRQRIQISQEENEHRQKPNKNKRQTTVVQSTSSATRIRSQSPTTKRIQKKSDTHKIKVLQASNISSTPSSKRKAILTVETGTASPILPFGELLAKTPIQKENVPM